MGVGNFGAVGGAHLCIPVAAGGDVHWGGVAGKAVREDDVIDGAL